MPHRRVFAQRLCRLRIIVLLCFVMTLSLTPLLSAFSQSPGAPPELLNEGSVSLIGVTELIDVNFGPADLMFCTPYPEGMHFVTTGEYLKLKGEVTQSQVDRSHGGQVVARDTVAHTEMYIPRPTATGWDAWTILLTRLLADEFRSKLPGKEQVVLRIAPDGHIKVIGKIAFVPAVDQSNRFVTAAMVPDLEKQFDESLNKAVIRLSTSGRMRFPSGATATEAEMVATFSVDRGLNTWFPDLHLIEDIPQDQESLWTARICAILDEGGLYAVADRLRGLLPLANRRRYVLTPRYDKLETEGIPSISNSLLTQGAQDYLTVTLTDYLKHQHLYEAELLAQQVCNDRAFKHGARATFPPHPLHMQDKSIAFIYNILDTNYVKSRQRKVLEELAYERRRRSNP